VRVAASMTSWSHVQRNPAGCVFMCVCVCVNLCHLEVSTSRRLRTELECGNAENKV